MTSRMNIVLGRVALLGVAVVSMAVTPRTATARSAGANAAGARPTCLAESFGGIVNNCGTEQRITYSAVTDGTNMTYHVTVRAQGASSASNVTCWGHGVAEDGGGFYLSNTQSLPFFGPSADLAPLNVFVPRDGVMNIYCTLQPRATVSGFHY